MDGRQQYRHRSSQCLEISHSSHLRSLFIACEMPCEWIGGEREPMSPTLNYTLCNSICVFSSLRCLLKRYVRRHIYRVRKEVRTLNNSQANCVVAVLKMIRNVVVVVVAISVLLLLLCQLNRFRAGENVRRILLAIVWNVMYWCGVNGVDGAKTTDTHFNLPRPVWNAH